MCFDALMISFILVTAIVSVQICSFFLCCKQRARWEAGREISEA